MPDFPNVPTLKELGYTEFVEVTWFGLSGPAGLPKNIVQKMNHSIHEVFSRPEIKERVEREGNEIKAMTPAEFTAFMASELKKWGPIASTLRTE
jgi:tripartite-type tricarboxylate transporter receptor subunit TctC